MLAERRAVDHLHGQVVGTDVVERAEVGMVQRRHRAGLAREAIGELLRRDLYRDLAAEPRVVGAIHVRHPTLAERLEDFVGPQAGARLQRHRRSILRVSARLKPDPTDCPLP